MQTIQSIIARLNEFWAKKNCLVWQPYDLEKGAGTFNPATFLRALGPEPFRVCYLEPCRRPKDGRYGTNPNRLQHYFQYQVLLKPSPPDIQDLYLESLEAIGLPLLRHDIRFVHDDWESPSLGAWGLGWEIWIDGQECSQFTYFQSVAGIPLSPITGEITYGIERLAMYLQHVDSIFDVKWNDEITYGDLFLRNEVEWSTYNFELADVKMLFCHFDDFAKQAKFLVSKKLPLPAYDFVIKASHAFNMLDARGAISTQERASYIGKIRDLARQVAECYIESRKEQNFPLLQKKSFFYPKEEAVPHAKEPPKEYDTPQDFVVEIGTEELPASFVPIGCRNFESLVHDLLEKNGIGFEKIEAMGTPRRLALFISKLQPERKPLTSEKKGPPLSIAFSPDGSPTKQGEGFFRSINKAPTTLEAIKKGIYEEVSIVNLKGTDYLFARQTQNAIRVCTLLEQELPALILKIDFPKKMRWADFDISFARPIRWLLSLFGERVLHFSCGPIQSGATSFGHRLLDPKSFTLHSASRYAEDLKGHHVIVNIEERKKEIISQLDAFEQKGFKVLAKEKVIPQVLHLVEWPFITCAEFNPSFLRAPRQVLISEMVEHQKYFPVADRNGELKNMFLITANTTPTDSIRKGNQKVISARLSDGVFLYEQDLKTPLEDFNEKIKGTIFQKELGTLFEKSERLASHAKMIAPYFPTLNLAFVLEACKLSKADLATEMVGEFPELQGTMGSIYAEKQQKPQEVARAIDEQWMPRGEEAPLPETLTGTVLSLADKIDNLLGFFAVDLKPTSSSDPFGLRRQGLGLIRIILKNKVHIPLESLLRCCLNHMPAPLHKKGECIDEILTFLATRARTILQQEGFLKEEIDAVLATVLDDFYDVELRLQALAQFRNQPSFLNLIEVHRRCQGQIEKIPLLDFSEKLLCEEAEKNLATALKKLKPQFLEAIDARRYKEAMEILAKLQPLLNTLFDKVKILAEDAHVQKNRLALLQQVAALFCQLADFQKIQKEMNNKG